MNPISRANGPGILRLYLAAAVLLGHLGYWPCIATWAVNIFFILSGYWICRLWDTKYSRCQRPYLVFMTSRYWRLMPVYATCTFLMFLCAWKVSGRWAAWKPYADSPWWRLSTFAILGSAQHPLLIPPAWSLDIEMQYYLLTPLLLMLLGACLGRPFAGVKTTLLLLVCAVAFWWMPLYTHVLPYLLFFLIGGALALTKWRPSRGVALGSAVAALAFILAVKVWPVTAGGIANGYFAKALIADGELGTPQIIDATQNEGDPGRWIAVLFVAAGLPYVAYALQKRSDKLDRSLGDLAYPLYLFHWIPLRMISRFRHLQDLPERKLIILAVAVGGSLAIYFLIDRPLDRMRRAFVESQVGRQPLKPLANESPGIA